MKHTVSNDAHAITKVYKFQIFTSDTGKLPYRSYAPRNTKPFQVDASLECVQTDSGYSIRDGGIVEVLAVKEGARTDICNAGFNVDACDVAQIIFPREFNIVI